MSNVKKAVNECYGAFIILTNSGFDPDNIFVSVNYILNGTPPGDYATVQLKTAYGDFSMNLVQLENHERPEFLEAYRKFQVGRKHLSALALDDLVKGTQIYKQRFDLLVAVSLKLGLAKPPSPSPNFGAN